MPAKLSEELTERIKMAILNGDRRMDTIERLRCTPGSYDNVRRRLVDAGVSLKHGNTGRVPGKVKPKKAGRLQKTAFTGWGYLSYV